MNTIQKLLFLMLSVPCAYGMEQSPDQTKSPQQLPLRYKVADYVVGAAQATVGGAVGFTTIGVELCMGATIHRLLANVHSELDKVYSQLPYVRLGAAVGLANFVYKKHQATIDAAGKRAYEFMRESGEVVGKHACKFAREQLAKERDWQTTLDPLLEANNTF